MIMKFNKTLESYKDDYLCSVGQDTHFAGYPANCKYQITSIRQITWFPAGYTDIAVNIRFLVKLGTVRPYVYLNVRL